MADWMIKPSWDTLNFQVICGNYGCYDRSWAHEGRERIADDFDRLYCLADGEAVIRSADDEIRLEPGKLYLFPGGPTDRRYFCPDRMTLYWLHLRVELFPGISIFSRYTPPNAVPLAGLEAMTEVMNSLRSESPWQAFHRVALVAELLKHFLPERWDEILPPSEKLEQMLPALRFVHESTSRGISLQELAAHVHLHPTYCSNVFRSVFGMPPMRLHQELRMRRAKQLLLSRSRSVQEVAMACGYEDPLYFSRQFRRYAGVSPTEFRKSGGPRWP